MTKKEGSCILIFLYVHVWLSLHTVNTPWSPLSPLLSPLSSKQQQTRGRSAKVLSKNSLQLIPPMFVVPKLHKEAGKSSKPTAILKPLCILPQKLRFSRNITTHKKTSTLPGIFLHIFLFFGAGVCRGGGGVNISTGRCGKVRHFAFPLLTFS